jgi:tungstate transport system substrate-binding protein
LLDYLLPDFESQSGVKVDVIAVGTGQAIALGEDGNADVLLVHARAREDEFMNAGHGTRREDVMYNDFVILGPEADPAGIKGTANAAEAFKKIAETQSPFISVATNPHPPRAVNLEEGSVRASGRLVCSAGRDG